MATMDSIGPLRQRGRTDTVTQDRRRAEEDADAPRMLRELPDGPLWDLAELSAHGAHRWIRAGAGDDCAIRLDAPMVSTSHCVLAYDHRGGRLQVADTGSKNGTRANGRRVDDFFPLTCGSVLELGGPRGVFLLVCGKAGADQKPIGWGENIDEYLRNAHAWYPSQRRASETLKVSRSRLTRMFGGESSEG